MIILGIDPGPEFCGVALYDSEKELLVESSSKVSVSAVIESMRELSLYLDVRRPNMVAIERVQSYGISGSSLLQTSESVGRLQQSAIHLQIPYKLVYRREVLKSLDVTGKGSRDAIVRQRLLEMHPRGKGTKKKPGPLYGIAGHAWSALAVAITAHNLFISEENKNSGDI